MKTMLYNKNTWNFTTMVTGDMNNTIGMNVTTDTTDPSLQQWTTAETFVVSYGSTTAETVAVSYGSTLELAMTIAYLMLALLMILSCKLLPYDTLHYLIQLI